MDGASTNTLVQGLQIAGWLLTIAGHVLITFKRRSGWTAWIAANAVLIALSVHVGLWWSIGMYLTNTVACLWSYCHWRHGSGPLSPPATHHPSRLFRRHASRPIVVRAAQNAGAKAISCARASSETLLDPGHPR